MSNQHAHTSRTLFPAIALACVILNQGSCGQSDKSQIDPKNFQVLGFTLGSNEVEELEAKLGRAEVTHASEHAITQRCYVSSEPDRTTVVFEDWVGTLVGFRIESVGADSKLGCVTTSLISANLITGSGLLLGLNKDQVIAILGKPTKMSDETYFYHSDFERPMNATEIERFKKVYPTGDFSHATISEWSDIELRFSEGRLISIYVGRTEST